MDAPPSIGSAAAVHEFLARHLADREKGEERPLAEHQAPFPGHEDAIARKRAELQIQR